MRKLSFILICWIGLLFSCSPALAKSAGEVEVLHWWTSNGEANAAKVLQQLVEQQNIKWKNFAVIGGGGESAMNVLEARVISGNPPTSAQLKSSEIHDWAALEFLTNLDPVAKEQHWDEKLPPTIARLLKYQGHYVAVPANIHRENWLWINSHIFSQVGVEPPTTWNEFFDVAEKIKQAGYPVLVGGNQDWQNATIFESVAIGVLGGPDYIKAFVHHDSDVLTSSKMEEVFNIFQRIHQYITPPPQSDDWNQATNQLIHDKAAMQIMGDWVKSELQLAGKKIGRDYQCLPVPLTRGQFLFDTDSFAMFHLDNPRDQHAQDVLTKTIMSPEFQVRFNLAKGSIPIRNDIPLDRFNSCAISSKHAFEAASQTGQLAPSIAHGMASSMLEQKAIFDVVNHFFNSPDANPHQAMLRLNKAIQAAQ